MTIEECFRAMLGDKQVFIGYYSGENHRGNGIVPCLIKSISKDGFVEVTHVAQPTSISYSCSQIYDSEENYNESVSNFKKTGKWF